jgi:CubicO group peptidase (beta-lactamase class C family)
MNFNLRSRGVACPGVFRALLVSVWCSLAMILSAASPAYQHFSNANKLAAIDSAVLETIQDHLTPGGILWIERSNSVYQHAYGRRAVVPSPEAISLDTIYDAASLTKVLATAPAIALLIERGSIKLDAPVVTYLADFTGEGRDTITIRHLVTHTSGLRPGIALEPAWSGYTNGIKLAVAEKPTSPPGTVFRYSDVNFILLGEVVRRVSSVPLDEFCQRWIYRPLRMKDTSFHPPAFKRRRIAPTEFEGKTMLRGIVHDPTSRRMGGVSGHAGVFTTAADVARYARMMLAEGTLDGTRVFKSETIRLLTTVQSPAPVKAQRGLGWDIDSDYSRPRGEVFPIGSYGHTGWTGTCIWIDPASQSFWVFLSNRNHPDGKGNVLLLERKLGTLAAELVLNK